MKHRTTHGGGSEPRSRPSRIGGWVGLFLGLASIWAFIFHLAPWLEGFEPIGKVCEAVRESGIEAGAYYYTDVEECAHAERFLRNSLGR